MPIPLPIVTAAISCAAFPGPPNLAMLDAAIAVHRANTESASPTSRDILAHGVIQALPACFRALPHVPNAPKSRAHAFVELHVAMLALTGDYPEGECEGNVVRLSQGLDDLARRILGHSLPWKNEVLVPA